MRKFERSALAAAALSALALALAGSAQAAYTITLASGADVVAITATVDAFRSALGPLNANVAGSFGSGRREINWDGVPDTRAAPNPLPPDFFNVNSPRGVTFSTPGSGFRVSADSSNPTTTPREFGDINPAYPAQFGVFSAERLFTAIGSTVTDVRFFVPGTAVAASSAGFGAVFTDVDVAGSTSMSFYDALDTLVLTIDVPASGGDQGLSFLGVRGTAGETFGRVRITSGSEALSAAVPVGDVVAMDDFIYGEPIAVVPEPATALLAAGGLSLLGWRLRRARRGNGNAARG